VLERTLKDSGFSIGDDDDDPATVGTKDARAPKLSARLGALLTELIGCHPLVLSDAGTQAIEAALELTPSERERLGRMWRDSSRTADALLECMRTCVFTAADAALLHDPGAQLHAASAAERTQFTALVAEHVGRCRAAGAVAADSARASPPSS